MIFIKIQITSGRRDPGDPGTQGAPGEPGTQGSPGEPSSPGDPFGP